MTKATAAQVRKHYIDQGYEVRISEDGHVEFRHDGAWMEGRYVSEYRVVDGNVHLT